MNGYELIKELVNTMESEAKINEIIFKETGYITDHLPELQELDTEAKNALINNIDFKNTKSNYQAFTIGFNMALTMLGYKPLFNNLEATE